MMAKCQVEFTLLSAAIEFLCHEQDGMIRAKVKGEWMTRSDVARALLDSVTDGVFNTPATGNAANVLGTPDPIGQLK